MDRRALLVSAGAIALAASPLEAAVRTPSRYRRVRPPEAAWPGPEAWKGLGQRVGGRLVEVRSPFAECAVDPGGATCAELFRNLRNPYFIGDDVALT